MTDIDPVEAGRRLQEVLIAPRPVRSIEEWEHDVGAGWRPLIRGLDANLRDLDPEYHIGQIKEKFGGLRYYLDSFADPYREEAYRLIRIAEEISLLTCEDCGGPGQSRKMNGYWVKTLCPRCYRDQEDEREFQEAVSYGNLQIEEEQE